MFFSLKKIWDLNFRHSLRLHYNGELYECHCGSVFKSKRGWDVHTIIHKKENLACNVCQKQFSTYYFLKAYRLKELGECKEMSRFSNVITSHTNSWTCFYYLHSQDLGQERPVYLRQVRFPTFKPRFILSSHPKAPEGDNVLRLVPPILQSKISSHVAHGKRSSEASSIQVQILEFL